jgi:hypothetical protein
VFYGPVQLRIDILGYFRERLCRVLSPEVVFRVKVVGLLLELAVLRSLPNPGKGNESNQLDV